MFGIKGRTDEEFFTKVLGDVIVPDFAPKEGVKIAKLQIVVLGQQQQQIYKAIPASDTSTGSSTNTLPP